MNKIERKTKEVLIDNQERNTMLKTRYGRSKDVSLYIKLRPIIRFITVITLNTTDLERKNLNA